MGCEVHVTRGGASRVYLCGVRSALRRASVRMPPPRRSGSRTFHISSRLRRGQAQASDADTHHPLTCELMERFEADLVKIAGGDVSNVPQHLLALEAIMQRIHCPAGHPKASIAKQGWSRCAHPHLRYLGFWLPRGWTRRSNGKVLGGERESRCGSGV